jgi:hypothetical protein
MKNRLAQRHSMIFSTVLTRITMMGKVRNMNQREARNDFFSSFAIMGVTISIRMVTGGKMGMPVGF